MAGAAAKPHELDPIESEVDEAIAIAGGARQAIKGLILGQRELRAEAEAQISAGYVRRELRA